MAHEKKCPVCQNTYWGNLNKLFCSDACRKYASRNPEKVDLGFDERPTISSNNSVGSPQLSVKGRTNSTSLGAYAAKRLMDVVAHNLMNGSKSGAAKREEDEPPLTTNNLSILTVLNQFSPSRNILLPETLGSFFGNLCFPFKMLVWGMPGQGKSTFCLQLANALSKTSKLIYVSAEEDPNGITFMSRVKRTVDSASLPEISVLNRLPKKSEWQGLLAFDAQSQSSPFGHILYDSLSVIDIKPNYPKQLAKELALSFFDTKINHVFISHAQKDGKSYLGPASWAHDVDIVVRVDGGEAFIEKNRFASVDAGLIGSTIKVF
jgi:predicted ATP-dependent serine protease